MPPRFHRLTIDEFARVLAEYRVIRQINAVHMHHTWSPDHAEFRGHQSIVGMWRFHTQERGWSTIAQHITIDPEGFIWTGRDWNSPPASAAGNNGTTRAGPFMFEMIGNFDDGHDVWKNPQKDTTLRVIALVQQKFNLPVTSLRFHNHFTNEKTCPGEAIKYGQVLREVETIRKQAPPAAAARNIPLSGFRSVADEVLEDMAAATEGSRTVRLLGLDPADAEPDEAGDAIRVSRAVLDEPEAARGSGLSASQIAALRPYIINLRQGQFSDEGEFTSSEGDIEAIVENLRIEIDSRANRAQPLRIVFWAHGGLVSEAAALQRAHDHVHRLWRPNGVYPIYFIWETGLLETLGQMLEGMRQRARGARDIFDHTTDRLVERLCRRIGVDRIWESMKLSAERASAAGGGAHHAATRLAELFGQIPGNSIELHAVGHSAGSIFHSHFIPAAAAEGFPPFESLHLLAPAVTIPDFLDTLEPVIGSGAANEAVRHAVMYTMKKDLERADNCKAIYRKSLLYLIHHALEPEPRTPILGLEENVRVDRRAAILFGLRGDTSQRGEVVWSESILENGRSASRSRSHGGFDDDPATLNSILRRVLNVGDTDRIKEYTRPSGARSVDPWESTIEWPEELMPSPRFDNTTAPLRPSIISVDRGGAGAVPSGRRVALCVGIDSYSSAPLEGCVADAKLWAKTLSSLGFEVRAPLLNQHATRSAILRGLDALVRESRAGDVVVFQFAGHGTQLPDLSGDEETGDSPGQDEALCPFDMDSGAFVLDDDVGAIFDHIPDGVNFTCFIDCCHSGTISRFGVGKTSDPPRPNERARFIKATAGMIAAHRNFRAGTTEPRHAARGSERMREILFSACRSTELAYETNGQGQFTLHATRVLSESGTLTNEAYRDRVRTLFGSAPRQHPELHCAPERTSNLLLASATGSAGPSASFGVAATSNRPVPNAALVDLLRLICNAQAL